MKRDVEVLQSQKEEAVMARQEAEVVLRNTKKEMEVQELVRLAVSVQPTSPCSVHLYIHVHIRICTLLVHERIYLTRIRTVSNFLNEQSSWLKALTIKEVHEYSYLW